MTLLAVMNKYRISIHHASVLLGVTETDIVNSLLGKPCTALLLEDMFLSTREAFL